MFVKKPSTAIYNVEGPGFRDWSSLPTDLVLVIQGCLTIKESIRFGAVCVSWNRTVASKLVPPPLHLLWLIKRANSTLVMFDAFTKKEEYRTKLPVGSFYLGSTSDGCMFYGNKTELLVMNPLTRWYIRFPTTTTLCRKEEFGIIKFALLRRPTTMKTGVSVVVAVACCNYELVIQVAFSKSRGKRWTILGKPEDFACGVVDIIFHKDLLYVLTRFRGTVTWDIRRKHPLRRIAEVHNIDFLQHNFMVESSTGDELLQVYMDKMTEKFTVLKLEEPTSGTDPNWRRVTNLCGDDALLLSRYRAMCVSTGVFPMLRANCIYSILSYSAVSLVYCLGDGEEVRLPLGEHIDDWFTPRLSK